MELWIRSQDRESLVKVDNLYISVGNYICYYVENGVILQNYTANVDFIKLDTYVYEMPKE